MSFRIDTILIRDVVEYASSPVWENARIIPITQERARAQQKNPHAQAADPCLWVAISDDDGEVIGFCGSLPGKDARNYTRMGWNSCWWVDPDRGREAAMPLFYHFLKTWDQRVAFADMTSRTRSIIDQMGFCTTRQEVLVQSYLRIPLSKFISRLGVPGILLSPLILTVTLLVNGFQQIRISLAGRNRGGPGVEIMDRLDDEHHGFIMQHRSTDLSRQSQEEFNWIEQNPWLVPGSDECNKTGRKYPFSYAVRDYSLKWLVTRREKLITSLSLVSVRDGSLKVLYFFGNQPLDAIHALITIISSSYRTYSLIYAHPELISRNKEFRPLVLYSRNRQRFIGVSKKLLEELPPAMVMQLGDGDAVFT